MALVLTSNYAGQEALPYFQAALLELNSLREGGPLTVKQNIKHKANVKVGSITGAIQNASCDWNDPSTVTLTDRVLELKALEAATQILYQLK